MLDREYASFESRKDDLRRLHLGKFAVIVGEELVGVYDTDAAAYEAGLAAKGNVPMLIKQVESADAEQDFYDQALAAERADEPRETLAQVKRWLIRQRALQKPHRVERA